MPIAPAEVDVDEPLWDVCICGAFRWQHSVLENHCGILWACPGFERDDDA